MQKETMSSQQVGSVFHMTGSAATGGWFLATGSSVHVCNTRDQFETYHPVQGKHVVLANNDRVDVAGIGSVILKFPSGKTLTLLAVLHIPSFNSCLVSIGRLTSQGFEVSFEEKVLIYKDKRFVGMGCWQAGGGYRLNVENDEQSGSTTLKGPRTSVAE